jgi:protease I
VSCTNGPNTLVTSRKPEDLEVFCSELVRVFADRSGQSGN